MTKQICQTLDWTYANPRPRVCLVWFASITKPIRSICFADREEITWYTAEAQAKPSDRRHTTVVRGVLPRLQEALRMQEPNTLDFHPWSEPKLNGPGTPVSTKTISQPRHQSHSWHWLPLDRRYDQLAGPLYVFPLYGVRLVFK